MSNIINATSVFVSEKNKNVVDKIAVDLSLIKRKLPEIERIIVRGGCVFDVIHNFEPNDIDLFYAIKEEGTFITECRCKMIRKIIETVPFRYFDIGRIDLENSFEKEPAFEPIERTVGFFSFHTDYTSMLALDENGDIWTNTDALEFILKGIYEVRYEGFVPWAYFPNKNDNHHYYSFFCYKLIRGVAHIAKRNLHPGPKFTEILHHAPTLIQNGLQERDQSKFIKYARKKNLDFPKARKFIGSLNLNRNHSRAIETAFKTILPG